MGKKTSAKYKFSGAKNNLRLQNGVNLQKIMGAKIRILKIHDELASLAHRQQASATNVNHNLSH